MLKLKLKVKFLSIISVLLAILNLVERTGGDTAAAWTGP